MIRSEMPKHDKSPSGADAWTAAMRRGDFARAWEISDAILRERLVDRQCCVDWPRHFQFVWTGGSFACKRVLVRCYHGLGDTIQFIRFAAPLRAMAREVIVWAQPSLLPLIATAPGVDRVLPLHDGTPDVAYDVDVEIMELPHALRSMPHAVPRHVPYLFPEPLRSIPAALSGEQRARVGVVWQAGDWAQHRSVPVPLIAGLACVPGVRLFSLQKGAAQTDASRIPALHICRDTLADDAALLFHLDLVITVDTMMAHLAGALGVPVWTLLHTDCDWRWQDHRSDTMWYPTMRLFRQPRPGDWESVIAPVCSALRERFGAPIASGSARARLESDR
jgi:hypothetical protein